MRKILLLFLFSVALGSINAQERLFFEEKPYERVTTDNQGVVFLFMDASLDTYTPEGKLLRNFSNPTWGDITSVDAGITSKILVFYRGNGTILLLNNELAPIGNPLQLFDNFMMTFSLAAMGNPNKIVLWDENNQYLLITDLSLKPINWTHVASPGEFQPTDMQVVPEHRIALLDTLRGIWLLDFYGTFEREIPIPGITAMQLMKDRVIYLKDNTLYKYNFPTAYSPMSIEALDINLPKIKQFQIFQNTLYYIDTDNIPYKIKF